MGTVSAQLKGIGMICQGNLDCIRMYGKPIVILINKGITLNQNFRMLIEFNFTDIINKHFLVSIAKKQKHNTQTRKITKQNSTKEKKPLFYCLGVKV